MAVAARKGSSASSPASHGGAGPPSPPKPAWNTLNPLPWGTSSWTASSSPSCRIPSKARQARVSARAVNRPRLSSGRVRLRKPGPGWSSSCQTGRT